MPRGRPKDTHTKQLPEAERTRIRTLFFDAKMSYTEIVKVTGFSREQVRRACVAASAAPAQRPGRPRAMTPEQEEQLVEYVTSSKEGRRATFLQLSVVLFNAVFGVYAIRAALRRLGFHRYIARRKPPITEDNRQKRLAWALEHVNWTVDQWRRILWSDETWITGGHHRKQYVTRRPGEEWDPTCIVERHTKKGGWMFWGCFHGCRKGPGVFWEKDWGYIDAASYQRHIVPVIDDWLRQCRQIYGENLILMQDGAPGHSAQSTREEMAARGIQQVDWPPFSPDLNPIESCWNWMKDHIEDAHGLVEKPSYPQLRRWVQEAWDALPEEYLEELICSMPARCQAVIDANGMHTKY